MMRLGQAFSVFFRLLRDAAFAERVAQAEQLPASEPGASAATPPAPPRSDALTLLGVLQREGRLVDFLQEPIATYSDAQIGAAVRDVHRGCRTALERLFGLVPVLDQAEGAEVRVEKGYDPGRLRLTGQVTGSPPYQGTLFHPGWAATRCELPEWTGSAATALVVAPAEVEIK